VGLTCSVPSERLWLECLALEALIRLAAPLPSPLYQLVELLKKSASAIAALYDTAISRVKIVYGKIELMT
jgi:hypothetical protein